VHVTVAKANMMQSRDQGQKQKPPPMLRICILGIPSLEAVLKLLGHFSAQNI
jgi:hypothetical protein